MLEVGTNVKVKEPFKRDFPNEYSITEVIVHEDGQVAYILGECGGFDVRYLEVIV